MYESSIRKRPYSKQLYDETKNKKVYKLGSEKLFVLSKNEKRVICIEFADYVPKIREILHMTQQQFGTMCGISTDRLSRIENKHAVMTWSQYTSILFLCMTNLDTKEYLFANSILRPKVLQYFQQKDENIPPDINVKVHEEIEKRYLEENRR